MQESRRKKIIYVLLVAAIIYGLANIPGGSDKMQTEELIDTPTPTAGVPPASATQTINIEYYSSLPWGSDPFYRVYSELENSTPRQQPVSRWTLNGVIINDRATVAVINKTIVRIGDNVNGARVVDIQKDKVTLEQDGSEFAIHITRSEI